MCTRLLQLPPTPALEGEDGTRTPPGTLSLVDEPQLRVSPKRKVETIDLDMDSSVELPALQKKAWARSGRSSAGEDKNQWDNIPPRKGARINALPAACPGGTKSW